MDPNPVNVQRTLRQFDRHTNALMNAELRLLQQHLQDFLELLQSNDLIQSALDAALNKSDISSKQWWEEQSAKVDWESRQGTWFFPTNPDDMFKLQYDLICDQANNRDTNFIEQQHKLTFDWSPSNKEATKQLFVSKIIRPFCEDLRIMLDISTMQEQRQERASDSPPMTELAAENESRIFLSHKSANKPLVERYYKVLSELGYRPWMDIHDMTAGTELDRGILEGVKKSCAIVFFLTKDFTDENFLADEIDYARNRKREFRDRFSIIPLRFPNSKDVPPLLSKYIWIDVEHELDGLYEIVRALPIQLGPAYWRQDIDDNTP